MSIQILNLVRFEEVFTKSRSPTKPAPFLNDTLISSRPWATPKVAIFVYNECSELNLVLN